MRKKKDKPVTRMENGLEEPFSSSPHRPPNYTFYIHTPEGKFVTESFCAKYAAQAFIDLLADDKPFTWKNCATIIFHNGVEVSTTTQPDVKPSDFKHFELEEIITYEPTAQELAWEPPEPHITRWRKLAGCPIPKEERAQNHEPQETPVPAKIPRAVSPEKKPVGPRPDGLVSIGDIAEALKVPPPKARDALRRSKIEKPQHGWAWPNAEVDKIKIIIKENLR